MINERLDELYREYYKGDYCKIVRCGVINEPLYLGSKPKIVFILKEPNDPGPGGGNWSLPEELKGFIGQYDSNKTPMPENWKKTWEAAGIWAYSILHGFGCCCFDQLKNDQFVIDGLRYIGTTNLKRIPGGGSAIDSEIKRYAKRDKEVLIKEIAIMGPDLLICGSTYDYVLESINPKPKRILLNKIHEKPYPYSLYGKSVILDFWHPSFRSGASSYKIKSRQDQLDHLKILIDTLRTNKIVLW